MNLRIVENETDHFYVNGFAVKLVLLRIEINFQVKSQKLEVKSKETTLYSKQIYYKLMALWVVCEAMLGGIIHGLKLPVSGLIVGGAAVICICLIAYYYPVRGAILRATIVVAIFKMILSPQSPLPAYIAVFFQGVVGELIFRGRKKYFARCISFAVIALLESAVQRLLVMTILFGTDIWKAIDVFISGITGEKNITNYSYYLAIGYVFLHLIAGFAIGIFAARIPDGSKHFLSNKNYIIETMSISFNGVKENSSRRKINFLLIVTWLILLALFIQSALAPEKAMLPSNMAMRLFLRSILLITTWVVFINPLLMRLLHRWLEKKKYLVKDEIKEITNLIPMTKELIRKSWKISMERKGMSRIALFAKLAIYNSLHGE